MTIKVLLLNTACAKTFDKANIIVKRATVKDQLTLHDYHAIIIDNSGVLNSEFWGTYPSVNPCIDARPFHTEDIDEYPKRILEQISTGGFTFIFYDARKRVDAICDHSMSSVMRKKLFNDFLVPLKLDCISETGDTFSPRLEESKYYNCLIKRFPPKEITWNCRFVNLPKEAKILGVSRAQYPIFAEIPIGAGKLVVLPRFSDIDVAIELVINHIIPQIICDEEPIFTPKWLPDYSSTYEKELRGQLSEVETAKRLLYTKDKLLKKAVSFAFKKLGFEVTEIPDGTNPDLIIKYENWSAICEVKGHENRQTDRPDMLQLLGYSTENYDVQKAIFITNHEFSKNPIERKKEAYTQGAITLAVNNDFCILSTVGLYHAIVSIMQKSLTERQIDNIRQLIMIGKGSVI